MQIILEIPDDLAHEIDEQINENTHNECSLGALPAEGAWAEFQCIWNEALEKALGS